MSDFELASKSLWKPMKKHLKQHFLYQKPKFSLSTFSYTDSRVSIHEIQTNNNTHSNGIPRGFSIDFLREFVYVNVIKIEWRNDCEYLFKKKVIWQLDKNSKHTTRGKSSKLILHDMYRRDKSKWTGGGALTAFSVAWTSFTGKKKYLMW